MNAIGCPGSSARRSAISAATRAGASGSSTSQSGKRAQDHRLGGQPVAARERRPRAAAGRAPGRSASPGPRARRRPGRGRRAAARPGTSTCVPARASSRWAKTWSAIARSGSTRPDDDLAHRVRDHDVDPLERRHDRLVRRGQRRGIGHDPDVPATARARLVDEPAQDGERALGAGRDRLARRVVRVEAAARRGLGAPRARPVCRSRPSAPPARGWAGRRRGPAPRRRRSRPAPRPARPRSPPRRGRSRPTAGAGRRGPRAAPGVRSGWRPSGPSRPAPGRRRRPSRSPAGRSRRAAPPRARGPRCRPRPRAPAPAGPGRTRPSPSRTGARSRRRVGAGPGPGSGRRPRRPAGGPSRLRPLTPNRRRIARSWPIVVDVAAFDAPGRREARGPCQQGVELRCLRQLLHARSMAGAATGGATRRLAAARPGPGGRASAGGGSAAVRATWPIQTCPSVNRSAFQIGARAFVSSMA